MLRKVFVNIRFKYWLLFLILAIIFTYPAVNYLSSRIIGDGGDNYQNFIFQVIASGKIRQLEYPFSHSDVMRYPFGFDFGKGFESVLFVLGGAFLSLFINNVAAYNIIFLLLFSLNGLFSFLFFQYISRSKYWAIVGAVIFGYSSYVIGRSAGHLNLFFVGGFPLLAYALLRIKHRFVTKNLALVMGALTVLFLGSFLNFLILIIALIVCLPILILFFPDEVKTLLTKIGGYRVTIKTVLLLLIFMGGFSLFGGQHFKALLTGDYYKPDRSDYLTLLQTSPTLKDYVLPNSFLPLFVTELTKGLNDSFRSIDRVVFIGWVELLLFILFVLFYEDKRKKYFVVVTTIVFFVFSLGYVTQDGLFHLPYYFLHKIFPFSFMDEPARFFVVFYFFLTVGIVLFVRQWVGQWGAKRRLALFALVMAIVIFERIPFNYWLSPVYGDKPYVGVVKKEMGEAVLDIPVSYTNSFYQVLPFIYGKKTVSGSFQWFADTEEARRFIKESGLTRYMCGEPNDLGVNEFTENQNLVRLLKIYDISTVVVHKNDPIDRSKFYFPECANARTQASVLLPQLFMPMETKKQEVLSMFFPTFLGLGDTINFVADGKFYIDGIHAYPGEWLPVTMRLDDEAEIVLSNGWAEKGGGNATIDPFLEFNVRKGSKLSFRFGRNNNSGYSFIKVWYRYKAEGIDGASYTNDLGIEKIYEDDDAAVFTIH